MNTTIIYYTDNILNSKIFNLCKRKLIEAANGKPIISVSHEPMDLGLNICVGKQKRSWLTLYRQLFEGVEKAETEYIATAEHDCLYTPEHYDWIPTSRGVFYYNENNWLVQWGGNHPELNGMYSKWWGKKRIALSQLICSRELLLESLKSRLSIIDKDKTIIKDLAQAGEFGLTKIKSAQRWASSGRPVYIKKYFKNILDNEKHETFETSLPNLDIRHSNNFTGPRRGVNRRYDLDPWGQFKDMINGI